MAAVIETFQTQVLAQNYLDIDVAHMFVASLSEKTHEPEKAGCSTNVATAR